MRRVYDRLKERKVFEWGLAYLGGAWLTLEVVDLLAGNLEWPSGVFRSVLALLSVGFLAAVVLAWYHGERGRQRVGGTEVLMLAGLLVFGGAVVALVANSDTPVESAGTAAADPGGSVRRQPSDDAPQIRSLAVLPLKTIAPDPQSEAWLTDGMTELLTAELSTIRALTVISRTSAMRYANSDKSLPMIAEELSVDGLLVGSVFHAGDQVRITVQLIHGLSDRHVWSDSYERSIRDILELQAEVVQTVATEVEATLSASERDRLAQPRQVVPEAYEAYLRARSLMGTTTSERHARALPFIRAAIEADSTWAVPFALLADWHSLSTYYGVAPADAGTLMRDAALAAIERDSASSEGHVAVATYYADFAWDWELADRSFQRALALDPNNASAQALYATYLAIWGRDEEAIQHAQRGVELDPLSTGPRAQLALAFQLAERYEEAVEVAREAIDLDPSTHVPYYRLAWALFESGEVEEAVAAMERWFEAFPTDSDPLTLVFGAEIYAHAGLEERARSFLAEVLQATTGSYVIPSHVANVYVGLGEHEEALRWLQRAYESRDINLAYFVAAPWMGSLRSDPRFQELALRLDLPDTAWR
jgi:TolB-like protein/Flp pilus assembly protein TadD